MNKHTLSVAITFLFCTPISGGIPDGIYHKGWIDFNKNGKMDLYENPKAPLEDRVQVWGIERSGFFNGREKWAKGFENQRV